MYGTSLLTSCSSSGWRKTQGHSEVQFQKHHETSEKRFFHASFFFSPYVPLYYSG